jgi:hypothetical protein
MINKNLKPLRDLARGEFFRLSPRSNKTWSKENYDRSSGSFSCIDFDNINNERFIKGSQLVFVEFDF